MPEIDLREWKIVGALSILVIVITFIPNLVGMAAAPSGSVFWGLQTVNPRDTPIYYSQIEQAREGHLLFKNLYTSEDEPRFIFDPFWLGVGLYAKLFSLPPFAAYELARIFLIPIFLALAYIFIAYFFRNTGKRLFCFIFLIFASGISGLVWPLVETGFLKFWPPPMDLWSPESSTFYTLYQSPHFIASLLLTVLIFFLMLRAFEQNKFIYSFLAGLAALFFFLFHPYHVPTIFFVPAVFIAVQSFRKLTIRWDMLKHYLVLVAASAPAIAYHFWTLSVFWTRQQFALQNNLPTPPFYNFILTYGFIMVFAAIGAIALLHLKNKNDKEIFLLTWFPVQFILPFLPFFNFQRKLIESLHFVMVIIAVEGIYVLKEYLHRKRPAFISEIKTNNYSLILFALLVLISCGFSSYYVLARDVLLYQKGDSFVYLNTQKISAMQWLKNNSPEDSIIFSSYDNGNIMPAFAVRTVFLGSTGNTAAAKSKTERVESFFQSYDDKMRLAFLEINHINYLFYGPEERALGEFDPERAPYLEKDYTNNEITLYRVLY